MAPQLVKTLVHPDRKGVVWTAQFSPDGSKLLTSGYPSGIIQLFDTNSWKEIRRIDTPPGLRSTFAYAMPTPDFRTLYVDIFRRKAIREEKDGKAQMRIDCSGEIRVYDLMTGRLMPAVPASADHGPNYCSLSRDGRYLVVAESPSFVSGRQPPANNVYWDLQTGNRHELPAGYGSATFTPDGSRYVFAAFQTQPAVSSRVVVFDTATDQPLRTLVEEPGRMIASTLLSPDGRYVVASSSDAKREKPGDVRVWGLATGAEIGRMTLTGKATVYNELFLPDGRRLVVQDSEGGWFLWDVATRKTVAEHPALKDRLLLLKMFHPDGRVLIASSAPKSDQSRVLDPDPADLPQPRLQLLDVETGKELAGFVMPNGTVAAVALSPDGRWLAVGGYGAVHLIDLTAKR